MGRWQAALIDKSFATSYLFSNIIDPSEQGPKNFKLMKEASLFDKVAEKSVPAGHPAYQQESDRHFDHLILVFAKFNTIDSLARRLS